MLRDLKRLDWLEILKLPEERVPAAVILRGTRNLKTYYARQRDLLDDVIDLGSPNAVLEDVMVGRYQGVNVGFACSYGAPMTSEVTHLFGALGTRLVIQTGCCGALNPGMKAGDLVLPTQVLCGEGASQYYLDDLSDVHASPKWVERGQQALAEACSTDLAIHKLQHYTTSAMFAEAPEDLDRWHGMGCGAVDMETATSYAVATHFGMARVGMLFVFDNPREGSHVLLDEGHKAERRALGEEAMIRAALCVAAEAGLAYEE